MASMMTDHQRDKMRQYFTEARLRLIEETGDPRLSDVDFCRAINLGSTSFSQYWAGYRRPSEFTLRKMYQSGYFPDDIFGLFHYPVPEKGGDERLNKLLRDPIFKQLYFKWEYLDDQGLEAIEQILTELGVYDGDQSPEDNHKPGPSRKTDEGLAGSNI